MKEAIRQRALELGFDDCRFASADAPGTAANFQDWLAQNKNGGMQWLERNAEKRVDPAKGFAGGKKRDLFGGELRSSGLWHHAPYIRPRRPLRPVR